MLHRKSKSDVGHMARKIQEAQLIRTQKPQFKKSQLLSGGNTTTSNYHPKYYNEQAGGFSYDDFYDSLKALNTQVRSPGVRLFLNPILGSDKL